MEIVSDLWQFLWAVVDNWAALATGGVLMAAVWLYSVHKDKPIPRKVALSLAVVFLVIAFFKAWEEQYHRANSLDAQMRAKPSASSIQINVPPSQVIIEQSSGGATSGPLGYLQVMSIGTANEDRLIEAGKQVALNVTFQELGDGPIQEIQNFETLTVGSEADETDLKRMFHERLADVVKRSRGLGGVSSIVDRKFYNSAVSPTLTEAQAKGILDGSQRLYLHVWATWKSGNGRIGKLEQCSWVLMPSSQELAGGPVAMHSCIGGK